ncbi:hypothetical protein PVK06_032984 [Gossypium arboreum]|uniref:Cyclin N-terminal domain-containing protein n=1 Tax=Gossypium arboreum TaxID=29729 RepID=A0ABR0NWJ6_GOSAR|nr:hypothetical protein PVK06_032984 [Gossypium arboreum]
MAEADDDQQTVPKVITCLSSLLQRVAESNDKRRLFQSQKMLLITSVLVSAQFMDDICYINAYYAKVGSISTEEMNILEVDFLFGLGFQLNTGGVKS